MLIQIFHQFEIDENVSRMFEYVNNYSTHKINKLVLLNKEKASIINSPNPVKFLKINDLQNFQPRKSQSLRYASLH